MSLSLIDTSNLITVTSIDADGNETTTVNYDYLEEEALVTIPENPTNGDVIKALFLNSESIFMLRNVLKTDIIKIENEAFLVDETWWNAPYGGVSK